MLNLLKKSIIYGDEATRRSHLIGLFVCLSVGPSVHFLTLTSFDGFS